MKIPMKRRLLSLLTALAVALSLAPAALAEGEDDDSGNTGSTAEGIVTAFNLDSSIRWDSSSGNSFYLTLEPNSDPQTGSTQVKALLEPVTDQAVQSLRVSWTPTNSPVVGVNEQQNNTHMANIYGKTPGKEDVTVHVAVGSTQPADKPVPDKTIHVTVSGIKLSEKMAAGITIAEREQVTIAGGTTDGVDFQLFGNAASSGAVFTYTIVNDKTNIALTDRGSSVIVEGREEGQATLHISCSAAGKQYDAEIPITVTSNDAVIEYTQGCSPSKPLKFSDLEELIVQEFQKTYPGGTLNSLIGVSVPTSQGTLYLGYKSPEDTGSGAGSSTTYYAKTGARGPYISDLTFVPKGSFSGEKAEIEFTAQGTTGSGDLRTLRGRILVTLTNEQSELVMSTLRETPLKMSQTQFSKICQEQTGSSLDYVIFTLPPSGQGTFFRDYKDEWNYAARLSATEEVAARKLGDITFVPAQGFVGEVRVGYAGYSVSGVKYDGELVIQVKQGLNDSIMYNDNGQGQVDFIAKDFDDFCVNATGTGLADITFTPVPTSQGALYYNWTGSSGAAVTTATTYTLDQIGRLTFVPVSGFNGIVRIPFTATSRSGQTIKGSVEVHVQSKSSDYRDGDITYSCSPGQSVKLVAGDFANFCQTMTGKNLYYISFQELPNFTQGALYHNRTSAGVMGTHVKPNIKYFNSAAPYIMNLSFWATDNFSAVEIPFTGAAVTGDTFSGVMVIKSGAGAGSGAPSGVSYNTIGQQPAQFSGTDFDNACRQATNSALAYVRFALPASGQGMLYYDYRGGASNQSLDPSTALYRTGGVSIDKVSFVSAKGFSGTVSVPYTGWAIDGREFNGTVQINVQAANAMGGLVHYESKGEPVQFSASDIQTSAGNNPISVRLTGIPPESQGKLYYQYQGPTQYSWQGNTTTVYTLYDDPSVSKLTFVPKAGFYGTVDIPYVASNFNDTQTNGTIRVVVSPPAVGSYTDMGGYSNETKSAVEYLTAMGVVMGVGDGKYSPSASIRRGDFCLMLSRAFQFDVGSTATGFGDVPSGAYYAGAVNEMYALGIVNGIGGGMFKPSSSITRQDAALMVQRALKQAGISAPDGNAAALASYGDRSQVAAYAQGAVAGLAQLGIYPVSNTSTLSPKTNLTRADMALLLHRAMTQ